MTDRGYGMGCACADYDGDGHVDIYVTNVSKNILYRNKGDHTFEDVTDLAGVGDTGWANARRNQFRETPDAEVYGPR